MSESGRNEQLLSHEYDGIHEYDNPTPGWWHAIFVASTIFAIVYFLVFHVSPYGARLWPQSRLEAAEVRAEQRVLAQLGAISGDRETLLALSVKPEAVTRGAGVFKMRCIACHGADGGGVPALGLNLTDDYGKSVRMPEDIYRTIEQGVPGTAMVAWGPQMSPDDIALVSAYVVSLRGTSVPGGREPDGEAMPEWAPAPDAGR